MSEIYISPKFDVKLFNQKNESLLLIKNDFFSKKLRSTKLSLSENNIRNPLYQKSLQNYNNSFKNCKPYNFFKNYSNLIKNDNKNKDYFCKTNNNRCENSFSFNSNINSKDTFFSSQTNNYNEESNNNNYKNINSKIVSNDKTNNSNMKDNKDNLKILKIKPLNAYQKKIIKKLIQEKKVKKIIDSLLNSSKKDNYKRILSQAKIETKNRFPKEKMIDPFHYIRYNIQKDPMDKSLYRGIDSLMKDRGKNSKCKEYEINLLKKANEINNREIKIDHLNISGKENNIYKKNYEDMINQTKHYESFHFNKKDYLHNKLKKYSPYQNILDRTYKIFLNKEFGYKRQDFDEIIKKTNKRKINLEKNIHKYISFDTRVNNIIKSSKQIEKNANQKRKEHDKMIKKINKIICYY